jgi:hypothetical protein
MSNRFGLLGTGTSPLNAYRNRKLQLTGTLDGRQR